MRHVLFMAALSLCAMPAAASDDDYELAALLLKRGWFDLAEDLFQRIQKDTSLPRDKRSEAKYGLARVTLVRAERTRDPKKQVEACDEAIDAIQNFIDANADHPRRAEALADIGDLRQLKGKALVKLSKTDPDALDLAEAEFDAAERLFKDQITELENRRKSKGISPPNTADRGKDDYKRKLKVWEKFEQSMMFAKYNQAIAIFSRAETYRENPEKHPEMKTKLEEMIRIFDEFMWDYSSYFLAYDAAIYMGRASIILAKYSDRAKAERHWANCFRAIGTAKSPLRDPENRRSEMVRDLGTRGYYWEMKARIAYGDTKKGRAAAKEYLEAAKLAEELFRLIPSARKSNMGKAVQLEQAKSYCKAGKIKEGIALLVRLKNRNKDSWVENMAIDILGEYAGETNLKLAIESADNIFERGESWLYRALPKYRAALNSIKSEEEIKEYYPYCWYQIGRCYYWLGRYQEAALALGKVIFDGSPHLDHEIAGDAARTKLQALKRLVSNTGNSDDRDALDQYRTFVTARFPNVVGEGELAGRAIELENGKKYLESNALWQKLAKEGNPYHEEALFSIGQNYYKYAITRSKQSPSEADRYFELALKKFKDHLNFVETIAKKTKGIVRNAIGSTLFSCRIHGDERYSKGNPKEALRISADISSKFPKADNKLIVAIMTARLNAKLRLAEMGHWYCPTCREAVKPDASRTCPTCKKSELRSYLQEAEKDMQVLEKKYLTVGEGRRDYLRALALLASTFEESAASLAGSDPRLAKELTLKAIEYYVKYTEEEPDAIQGRKMLYMAEKLFAAAEGLRDQGTDEARKKAAVYFQKAGDLLKTFVANEGNLEEEDPVQARHIRRMTTRADIESGNYEEAISSLEELVRSDPDMADGSTWEDLADCYRAKAEAMDPSKDRVDLYKKADEIYKKLASALMAGNRINDHFYRLLYGHALCLSVMRPDPDLKNLFRSMDSRGYGRRFACSKCHEGFAKKDPKTGACPKCGNKDLFVTGWDDSLKFRCDQAKGGCGKKSSAREVKDFQSMQCTTCDHAYPASETNPFCKDPKCPGKGRARLRETVKCPSCKKVKTTFQISDWDREDWIKGPYHDRFEELRKKLKTRLIKTQKGR